MLAVMRLLKIDFIAPEDTFETDSGETPYHLDTETGEVLMVQDEFRGALENLRQESDPEAKLEDRLRDSGLPDWQRQVICALSDSSPRSSGPRRLSFGRQWWRGCRRRWMWRKCC
jgi:hypothetical protein